LRGAFLAGTVKAFITSSIDAIFLAFLALAAALGLRCFFSGFAASSALRLAARFLAAKIFCSSLFRSTYSAFNSTG
jgi:hypothetical protein